MTDNSPSTYDILMQDPKRRQKFEEEYRKFVLVETLIPLLKKSKVPVRTLAKAAGVSPTIIQEIKSGKKEGISYSTFLSILEALGYQATLRIQRKGKRRRSPSPRKFEVPFFRRKRKNPLLM